MHYSAKAFSKDNKKLTIVTKNGESIGQRLGPSDLDIKKIRHLYGCEDNKKNAFHSITLTLAQYRVSKKKVLRKSEEKMHTKNKDDLTES